SIQPGDNADALIGMGVVANAKHDFAAGVRYGRQALAIEPEAAHILGVIGDGQLELGRYPQAFATFQRMVRMRPDIASYARVSYGRELGDAPRAPRGRLPRRRRVGELPARRPVSPSRRGGPRSPCVPPERGAVP